MNKPIPTSAPRPEAVTPERRWKVGTLTYTKGGLVVLFAWLLWGDFAWMIKERAAMPIAQLLLRQLQASDFFVGLAVGSLPAALAMVLGPIISVRSDRHRGRWGRRIPYLLVPTPFMVLGIVGLAFAPRLGVALDGWMGASSPGVHACRLIAFSFFWGLFEIFTTIANAVFNALIADVVPDAVAGRFFGMFRAVGLLSGIVFNLWVIGIAEQHMTAILIGVGLVYGIGFALMCLRVREGEYPPVPAIPSDRTVNWWQPLRNYARECFTNPHYVWIFVAMMLGGVAGAPINSFGIFFAKSLNMSMETYGRLLVLTFSISFALSFLMGWLADRFHPLRVGMTAIGLYGLESPLSRMGCSWAHS
jgi:Na+/melibiose symporter-like transporter